MSEIKREINNAKNEISKTIDIFSIPNLDFSLKSESEIADKALDSMESHESREKDIYSIPDFKISPNEKLDSKDYSKISDSSRTPWNELSMDLKLGEKIIIKFGILIAKFLMINGGSAEFKYDGPVTSWLENKIENLIAFANDHDANLSVTINGKSWGGVITNLNIFIVSQGSFEFQLPENTNKYSYMKMEELKESFTNDPELGKTIILKMWENIENGQRLSGYKWYFDEKTGHMIVEIYNLESEEPVKILIYDRTGPQWNEDGTLKSNIEYQSGEYDYTYKTDDKGRIISCETTNLQITKQRRNEDGTVDRNVQNNPITPDKTQNDDAGHIIGDQFGGSPDVDNLVSQLSDVNQGEYYKMEMELRGALNNGETVQFKAELFYENEIKRPSEIIITFKIGDGDWQERRFPNDAVKE